MGLSLIHIFSPTDADLLRLLTSIAKLTTGRQAVAVASEVLELSLIHI